MVEFVRIKDAMASDGDPVVQKGHVAHLEEVSRYIFSYTGIV